MIHNSGAEPQDLNARYGTAEGVTPDYRIKHFDSEKEEDPWSDAFKQAEKWMNDQADFGFAVTGYNRSIEDSANVFVLYWSKANNEFYK